MLLRATTGSCDVGSSGAVLGVWRCVPTLHRQMLVWHNLHVCGVVRDVLRCVLIAARRKSSTPGPWLGPYVSACQYLLG